MAEAFWVYTGRSSAGVVILAGYTRIKHASTVRCNIEQRAFKGAKGEHMNAVRALLASGQNLQIHVEARDLAKEGAKRLKTELQKGHSLHGRRGLPYRRVHQQKAPNSPYLDPSPVYYVYELVRPDTGAVFYVGKGSERQPPRVDDHVRHAKNGKRGHKFSVIRKLLRAGLSPEERRVSEHQSERQALLEERRLVKARGLDQLTNDAPGGQSPPTGDDHWTRKHPEKVLRGDKHPARANPELRRKLAEHCRTMDPACRARGERHGMVKLSDAQVADLRARFKAGGATRAALAEEFGVSPRHVGRLVRAKNRGGQAVAGPQHGNAKLSPEQRAEIRERRNAGESGRALANAFGVSPSLVSCIAHEG